MTSTVPRSLSLWADTLDRRAASDGPLDGSTDADVAIVGAGYTGLWTAYYLARQLPDARIVVVESEHVGFGASGRNGGWCSAIMPMSLPALARRHGRASAVAMQDAMIATVHEVRRVAEEEDIRCDVAPSGTVTLARSRAQVRRLHERLDELEGFGFGADYERWLSADETQAHVMASDVLGSTFTPHCMALHPARLVNGLADACRRRGVVIHDRTRVIDIVEQGALTERGAVRAPIVLRATEAYTSQLPRHRRDVVPIYSLMIATEPLDDSTWRDIGLDRRPTFHDERRLVIYGQRTADNRLAFGGRGAPYHFGSRIAPGYDGDPAVHAALHDALVELFPSLADAAVTHRWGGALAAPRDWHASVHFDPATGRGAAGGYVGDGVATANLAGRTLADLVSGQDTDITRLPWVGHRSRRWEPEPLRWIAIRSALRLTNSIDRTESAGKRSPRVRTRILDSLTGN